MSTHDARCTVCIPIFPNFTILDVVGPWQVFSAIPGVTQYLAAASTAPVVSKEKMTVVPDHDFACCPEFDVLMVPGGPGQVEAMVDPAYMDFLRTRGPRARWVTSDCVGALLLAWAGLLDGYRATTHWASVSALALFPHVTVASGYPRYVVDRNRVTGGGVSSGIDQALELARMILGDDAAQQAQLLIQYAPAPPFGSGDPCGAPPHVVEEVETTLAPIVRRRREQIIHLLGGGGGRQDAAVPEV